MVYTSVSQPFLSCVPPEPICHTTSTPMLMILKKYNVTQVIIKCFHVPPAVCLRTPRGTRTPGWESLDYTLPQMYGNKGLPNVRCRHTNTTRICVSNEAFKQVHITTGRNNIPKCCFDLVALMKATGNAHSQKTKPQVFVIAYSSFHLVKI